jgi:uncharacterized membrane protein
VKPDQPSTTRARQWYRPTSIVRSIAVRPRVYGAALAAAMMFMLMPQTLSTSMRAVIAGDVGALVYLALALQVMLTSSGETTRKRAVPQDDSAIVILVVILIAIALGFGTIFGVLGEARQAVGAAKTLQILLAAATILLSWLVTRVAFIVPFLPYPQPLCAGYPRLEPREEAC